jgi:hypothetical protein
MKKITITVIIILFVAVLLIQPYHIEYETVDYGISNTHIQKGICIGKVSQINETQGTQNSILYITGSKCSGIPILLSEVLPGLGPLN